ncbi:MAG: hypothetical protein ACPMAQ_05770 [Phycisphaerae bacterium]
MVLNRMGRWGQRLILTLAAASIGTTFESCTSEDAWRIFRDSASPSIGEGLKTMFGGVVDGIVAVVDPSGHSGSSSSSGSK